MARSVAAGWKARHWAAFEERVLRPAHACVPGPPLAELAPRAGFASAPDAAAAIQVVRQRVSALIREIAGDGTDTEEEAAAESRRVVELLG